MVLNEAIKTCILADKVPYIEGPPGWGKSALVKFIGRLLGVKVIVHYLAQRAGNEIHGIPVVKRETLTINGVEHTLVEQAPPRVVLEALEYGREASEGEEPHSQY